MKPIRNGNPGRCITVTKCCGVPPETGGSYGQYYRRCPNCGDGDIFRDVTQESEYIPSAAERELDARVRQLEETVARLAALRPTLGAGGAA